jgi:hypothetical protein
MEADDGDHLVRPCGVLAVKPLADALYCAEGRLLLLFSCLASQYAQASQRVQQHVTC